VDAATVKAIADQRADCDAIRRDEQRSHAEEHGRVWAAISSLRVHVARQSVIVAAITGVASAVVSAVLSLLANRLWP
jgi:transcription elongation GreA/GreB family factor